LTKTIAWEHVANDFSIFRDVSILFIDCQVEGNSLRFCILSATRLIGGILYEIVFGKEVFSSFTLSSSHLHLHDESMCLRVDEKGGANTFWNALLDI